MEKVNKVLFSLLIVTLILLFAVETNWFSEFEGRYKSYFGDILLAIVTGTIVGIVLNYLVLEEQQEENKKLLNIGSNVIESGFSKFHPTYKVHEVEELLSSSKQVDFYVTYADRTLGILEHAIKKKLREPDFNINIYLMHEDNPFLASLANLWGKDDSNYDLDGLKQKINRVVKDLARLKNSLSREKSYHNNLNVYKLKYHPVFFSFYRFDDKLIFVPAKLIEPKNINIPSFTFINTGKESDIYNWCMEQLTFINRMSESSLEKAEL